MSRKEIDYQDYVVRPLSPPSAEKFYKVEAEKRLHSKIFIANGKEVKFTKKEVFIFANGRFFVNPEIEIDIDAVDMMERVKPLFDAKFPESNVIESARRLLALMNNAKSSLVEEKDKKTFINPQIRTAAKPIQINNSPSSYYSYSSYRTNSLDSFEKDLLFFVARLMTSTYIVNLVNQLNSKEGKRFSYEELPARISKINKEDEGIAFARDSSVIIGGEFFQTHPKIIALNPDNKLSQNTQNALQDFSEKVEEVNHLPFPIQGGNVVVDEEKKVILICDCFNDGLQPFVNKNGEVEICNGREIYPLIKDWVEKELGYQLVVVERKPNEEVTLQHLYHLDVFMNVIGPYVFLPEENIISNDTIRELVKIYGASNIIRISKEERKALCTNFISFENNVLVTGPDIPESFFAKLNAKGLNVITPPFLLSVGENAGIRCGTQIAPEFLTQEFFEALSRQVSSEDEFLDAPEPEGEVERFSASRIGMDDPQIQDKEK